MTVLSRKHQVVLDVSFNRPLTPDRARYLIWRALKDIEGRGVGRDLTRPGMPEARIINTAVKQLSKVIASKKVVR